MAAHLGNCSATARQLLLRCPTTYIHIGVLRCSWQLLLRCPTTSIQGGVPSAIHGGRLYRAEALNKSELSYSSNFAI